MFCKLFGLGQLRWCQLLAESKISIDIIQYATAYPSDYLFNCLNAKQTRICSYHLLMWQSEEGKKFPTVFSNTNTMTIQNLQGKGEYTWIKQLIQWYQHLALALRDYKQSCSILNLYKTTYILMSSCDPKLYIYLNIIMTSPIDEKQACVCLRNSFSTKEGQATCLATQN